MEPQFSGGAAPFYTSQGPAPFYTSQGDAAVSNGYPVYTSSSSSMSPEQLPRLILRAVAVVLTFIAAITMGVAKENVIYVTTELVDNHIDYNTEPGNIKSSSSSAFMYFVVINVLVFIWSVASVVLSLLRSKGSELLIAMIDLVALSLLFSSNGAASTTILVADNGSYHFGWPKFCDATTGFCSKSKAANSLSMFAAIAYLVILMLTILALRRRA